MLCVFHSFHFNPQEHASLRDVPLSQVCQTQATLLSLSPTGTCQPVGRATQPSLSNTSNITFTFNHRNMPICGTCHSAKSVKHKQHYFHFQPQEHANLRDVPLSQVCQTQATLLSLSLTGTCQPAGRATRPSLSNTGYITFTFTHRNMPACGTCHPAKSVKHKLHYFHFHHRNMPACGTGHPAKSVKHKLHYFHFHHRNMPACGTCHPAKSVKHSLHYFHFHHRNMPACGTCHSAKSVKHKLHYFHFHHRNMPACGTCHPAKSVKHKLHYFHSQEHANLRDVPLGQVCQTQATLLSLSLTRTCQPAGRATRPSLSNTGYITFPLTFTHRNMPTCGTCHSAKSVKHKLHYFHFHPQEHANLWDVPLGQVCQTQATLLSLSLTGTCQPVGRATRPSLSNTSYITFTFTHRNMPTCGTCHSAKSVKHRLHYFHFHHRKMPASGMCHSAKSVKHRLHKGIVSKVHKLITNVLL